MCLQLQLVILVVVVHPSGVQKAHLLSEFNKTELMSFATRIGAACRARDRKTAIVAAIIVEFDAREAQQHNGSV